MQLTAGLGLKRPEYARVEPNELDLAVQRHTRGKTCVLVQPGGWARGEREGYGGPCDVTSLSLSLKTGEREGYGGPAT